MTILSPYKKRSQYFEQIAHDSKLIAHDRPSDEDPDRMRKSFFRMNDLKELDAACAEWAHFPCVVHVDHTHYYRENGTGIPRRINSNELLFLCPLNDEIDGQADQMEDAFNLAMHAMSKFIAFIVEDMEANSSCGNLFIFTLSQSKVEKVESINGKLYGWSLVFNDEQKATELCYTTDDWFEGVENGMNHTCGCIQDSQPPPTGTDLSDYILFTDQDEVILEWDATRRAQFGEAPCFEVWFQDDDNVNLYRKVSIPVYANAAPPDITEYRFILTGNATGFITIN